MKKEKPQTFTVNAKGEREAEDKLNRLLAKHPTAMVEVYVDNRLQARVSEKVSK